MRLRRIFLIFILSSTFFASCGPEDKPVTRLVPGPSLTGTGTSRGSSATPIDSKSGTIYAGNSVSFQIEFANPYDTQCVDGLTPISWKLIGDSSEVTLTDTDKCKPTLTTSDKFDGGGQIVADLGLSDPGLVRYTATLALKNANFFHFVSPVVPTNAWWKNVPSSISQSTAQSWYYSNLDLMLLYNNSRIRNCAGHPYFYNAPNSVRSFQVQLPPGAIADLNNESGLKVVGTCSTPAYKGIQYFIGCPLEFDPIDVNTGIVTFRFAGTVGGAPGCGAEDWFFAKNNYLGNPPLYDHYVFPFDIQLRATHPHIAKPVTASLGTFKLGFTYD